MTAFRVGLLPAIAFALSLDTGVALAQTAPAAPPMPGMDMTAPATKTDRSDISKLQKASISKACVAAADKQKLKGKPRTKFEEGCLHRGGPKS